MHDKDVPTTALAFASGRLISIKIDWLIAFANFTIKLH